MSEPTKRKVRKANLNIKYVVHKKEEVDDMKARFDAFLKHCDIYERSDSPYVNQPIPVILSQAEEKNLTVNLDPCCELAFYDFESVVAVVHNVNELKFVFKGGYNVKINVSMMGVANDL